jgi:6-phospho-beta-glucosidase
LKVTVIGGGSTYTPELVSGLLELHATLPITELWLMDVDNQRLKTLTGFAQRMVAKRGALFQVLGTSDRREAIRDASYVITQIRVGGMAARREDEYLGRRHGLIGQETTGVGGMSMALRTIPVMLEIAEDISLAAPDALLANFTNPAGLITEAVARYAPKVEAVGICNVATTMQMDILRMLEAQTQLAFDPHGVTLDILGLNHLSWSRGLKVNGEEVWPQVLEIYLEHLPSQQEPEWPPQLIRSLGMIPNYYLGYYYNTKRKLTAQTEWPPSRAEQVMELEAELMEWYADPNNADPPATLMKRGGAYYSSVATRLLNAVHNDLGEIQVLNVPHQGAISDWPHDWVLELPCLVDRRGVHPLAAEPLPPTCAGLIEQVKTYELLTVEAALHSDREAAFLALVTHPLGPDASEAEDILEDMLSVHREYLPQFWG